MYSPSYTITHYILSYIVKSELAIERITTFPLPEVYSKELYLQIKTDDIERMGRLIGHVIGYNKALAFQKGKVLPTGKTKDRIFINYRSVHDFISLYTSQRFFKPSTELMLHINKLLGKGIVDEWEAGKLRTFSEKPNDIYDVWYKHRDFYPNLIPKRFFDEIFTWINNVKTKEHKLIQLAVLLYEFIDKAPFSSLNQITALLTISATAKEYGYNPNNLIPFAKSVDTISEDLISAFKISKSKRDLTIFIEAFLYSLSLSFTETAGEVKAVYSKRVKKYSKLNENLNPRQVKILEYLETERRVTRNEYSKIMGISFMTAFRDLQELLEKGYTQQKGVGRGTYYILKKEITKKEEKPKEKVVFSDIY